MNQSKARKTAADLVWIIVPLLAVLIGVVLRMVMRTSAVSMWEDEMIAAVQAMEPPVRILTNLIIGEVHPPLYFLWLHFWALISPHDEWLIVNSIIFGLAAVASLFVVVRRLHGLQDALIATAVFAVLPVAIWMSGEVRMYSTLSVLFIWTYYFIQKAFVLEKDVKQSYFAVLGLSLLILGIHAISFVAILFFGIYAATWLYTRKAARREWFVWLGIFGTAGLFAMPVLIADALHGADMAPMQSWRDVLGWAASTVTGMGYQLVPWLKWAGLAVYLIVVTFGTFVARTRRLTLCFLVAPLVLCLVVELAARPLFKTNFFSNFYSIFLALIIGGLIASAPLKKSVRTALFACVLVVLLTLAVVNRTALNTYNNYFHDVADVISANRQPGDVVWAPQASMFWGLAWYMVGPHWGQPVNFSEPLRAQSKWWKVFDWLGPARVKEWGLAPSAQSVIAKNGLLIMTSSMNRAHAEEARRVWLVTYRRTDLITGMPDETLGPLHRVQTYSFPPLEVNLYEQ